MKHWHYSDVSTSTHGLMVCSACGKRITDGAYRYRETATAYVVHHRACSATDVAWRHLDNAKVVVIHRAQLRLIAYEEFRARWETSALDDEIEELRRQLTG